MRDWKTISLQLLTIVILLGACEIIVRQGIVSDLYIAAPSNVMVAIFKLLVEEDMMRHFFVTFLEFFAGFVFAIFAGISVGLLMGLSAKVEKFLNPFLSGLMAVPKVTIIPLLILWLGIGMVNKIVVVFIFTFFLIIINTITGVKSTLTNHLKVSRVFEATRAQTIFKVILPSAVPSIFAGLRVGAATGIVGALFAEMLASREGLGNLISLALQYYDTAQLFAIILIVTILSICVIGVINLIERKVFTKWKYL